MHSFSHTLQQAREYDYEYKSRHHSTGSLYKYDCSPQRRSNGIIQKLILRQDVTWSKNSAKIFIDLLLTIVGVMCFLYSTYAILSLYLT